ncbi:MAG: NAD-dependent epimerase/dehydratase family protein [Chloroflexi bacterium]|nr:NAD-dependent epimerase/dehydratase family protein [Chloroflexota bacterium]
MQPLPESDLNHVLDHTRELWEELRGKRIFITGGTGFFGCWLLESLQWANDHFQLGARATVLSRNPEKFAKKMPHLANNPSFQFIQGDVCNFDFPVGNYAFVIHAATEASAKLNQTDPQRMFDTIVEGTRRTVEFASTHGTKKFLLISSGAVYGTQPPEISHIPEDYKGAPDPLNPLSAYGEGKRAAEMLCALGALENGIEMKIARCFAFVGPLLPLDAHFAIGNFIRDALNGGPIVIIGDGTPYRSYLYAADLAIWLWTILFKGKNCRPYNVGSDNSITIKNLSYLVRDSISPGSEVKILEQSCITRIPRQLIKKPIKSPFSILKT